MKGLPHFLAIALVLTLAAACKDDPASSGQPDAETARDVGDAEPERDTAQDVEPEPDLGEPDQGEPDAATEDAEDQDTAHAGEDAEVDTGDPDAADVGADTGEVPEPLVPVTAKILVAGPASGAPEAVATQLRALLDADGRFPDASITSMTYGASSLLTLYYRNTGREARLAPLRAGGWDYVVLLDDPTLATSAPELHFEGVRTVSDLVRAGGAKPLLLTTGGPTDIGWRVGNGTGSVVVPAAAARTATRASDAEWPLVAAGSLYARITSRDPGTIGFATLSVTPERVLELAEGIWQTHDASANPQYTEPFQGVVRIRNVAKPARFPFLMAGTSSERGWVRSMTALLGREGVEAADRSLGSCNNFKRVDAACVENGAGHFEDEQFYILYARGYDVSNAYISENGNQEHIQAQLYDRHYDRDTNDGHDGIDQLELRSQRTLSEARRQGLAWIPMHLNFAKLELALPGTELLSDGVHATRPVQDGLATMSWVSATGLPPTTDGLDPTNLKAVTLGDETIRQLSTLSASGEHTPDTPESRPTLQ